MFRAHLSPFVPADAGTQFLRQSLGPRIRVWSREIVERLERRQVAKALEASSIVIGDEAVEEGIAVSMGDKAPMRDAAFGLPSDGFHDTAVEAFDETVGLRPVRSGQAVLDLVLSADEVERVSARRPVLWLVLHVDSEAIGELAAVVGEDGVDRMREVIEEAIEESF